MSTNPNIVERAYRKLNTATKLTISTDEWIALLASGLAVAVPQLTGIPWKYASPVTLFVTFSVFVLVRQRAAWPKRILVNAGGCLILYLILALFGSNR
ncbi:MAG TPA: hypothetical protein VD837_00520 [Terriglobales bacterium]|nr:hypothetical protein [Terriglobales bacterium]